MAVGDEKPDARAGDERADARPERAAVREPAGSHDDDAAVRRVRELLAQHVPLALIADLTAAPLASHDRPESEPDTADEPARRSDEPGPQWGT